MIRRASAALAPCGGFASGDAAGLGVDRGTADHGFEGGGVAFVVADEAAVVGEPGQGAFDAPAARMPAKPCWPSGSPWCTAQFRRKRADDITDGSRAAK
jgi:hypothetical protein